MSDKLQVVLIAVVIALASAFAIAKIRSYSANCTAKGGLFIMGHCL